LLQQGGEIVAELTTVDGHQILFDPSGIAAVADRDPATGSVVTCVHGITAGIVRIRETVVGFLDRLAIAGKFAKLTRPDHSPVWINAPSVRLLHAPLPGEYPADAKSVVSVDSFTQAVTEDVATARAAINALRGPGAQPL
jgi:hypothetical protein